MKKLLLILLVTTLLTGCAQFKEFKDNVNKKLDQCAEIGCSIDGEHNDESEEVLLDEINFKIMSFDEAYSFIENKDTGVLFLSFIDCPWCIASKPILEDISNQYPDIDTYYVDVKREQRNSGQETYDKFYDFVESELSYLEHDKIYMPTFIFLKNGNITKYHVGTVDDAKELNDSQKEQLKNIFIEGYESIYQNQTTKEGPYSVIKAVDGDTIRIYFEGKDTYVRLIGIDTPESVNPDESKNTPEGKIASDYTNSLIGDEVYLEFDVQSKDDYDRLLAYVYLPDGTMLNEKIIKDGYAYQMTIVPNVKYADLFKEAFEYALENKLGLWKEN